jgi:hypothetical protein
MDTAPHTTEGWRLIGAMALLVVLGGVGDGDGVSGGEGRGTATHATGRTQEGLEPTAITQATERGGHRGEDAEP